MNHHCHATHWTMSYSLTFRPLPKIVKSFTARSLISHGNSFLWLSFHSSPIGTPAPLVYCCLVADMSRNLALPCQQGFEIHTQPNSLVEFDPSILSQAGRKIFRCASLNSSVTCFLWGRKMIPFAFYTPQRVSFFKGNQAILSSALIANVTCSHKSVDAMSS